MSFKQRTAWILTGIVTCAFMFGAGVFTGLSYEGHLDQVSKNIDLSDYISLTIIFLLSIALWLSLSGSRKN